MGGVLRHKVVVAGAALLAGVAAGGPAAPAARADVPAGPTLVRVSGPSSEGVGPDATVAWTVQTSSGSNVAIREVQFTLSLDGRSGDSTSNVPTVLGDFLQTPGAPVDQTGNGAVTVTAHIGRYQAGGHYEVTAIHLFDAAGGQTVFVRDASGQTSSSSTETTSNHGDGPALTPADLDVVNASGDGTPPTISNLRLTTPTVTPGDPVVLGYSAGDDRSGVASVQGLYTEPGGGSLELAAVRGSDASGPLTAVLPRFGSNGTWTLASITVTDVAGNTRWYRPNDADLDLSVADLSVSGLIPDATGPVLTSLTAAAAPTAPGGWVGFGYTATDDASGVEQVNGFYNDPQGRTMALYVGNRCADPSSGVAGQGSPAASGTGIWTLQDVVVFDNVGNVTYYQRDGTVREQIGGMPSVATAMPGLNLSAGDVTVAAGAKFMASALTPCAPGTALTATAAPGGVTGAVTNAGVAVVDPVIGTYAPTATDGYSLSALTRGDASGTFHAAAVPGGGFVHFFGGRDRVGKEAAPADATPSSAKKPTAAVISVVTAHVRGSKQRRLKLSVTVKPAAPGELLLLQRPHGRSWTTVARARLGRGGRLTFTISVPKTRLRLYAASTALHLAIALNIRPALLR